MMRTRISSSLAIAGLLLVGGAALPTAASAAQASPEPSPALSQDASYCTAVPGDTGLPTDETVCFGGEAEVDTYLTDNGIRTEAPGVGSRAAAASVVLGRAYKDANLRGSSFTYYGANACSGSTFGFSPLASGWTNSISSAQGLNGCSVSLYANTGYSGDVQLCTPTCLSLPRLNDAVKSIVFRP